MRHVLGMAKRNLDLRGAKGPKLELDFLRLVYAVNHFRGLGDDAKAYLLVLTPEIKQRAEGWIRKYQAGDAVSVVAGSLSQAERQMLDREVAANVAGMLAGTTGAEVAGRSSASVGGALGEEYLRRLVEQSEPGAEQIRDKSTFPFGINWDYYGVRRAA
jgi:hypothetical protein